MHYQFQEILDQHQQMIAVFDPSMAEKGPWSKEAHALSRPYMEKIKHLHDFTKETINIELKLFLGNGVIKNLENDEWIFIITSHNEKEELTANTTLRTCYPYLKIIHSGSDPDISAEEWGAGRVPRTELGIWQTLIDSLHYINFIVQR